jgi:hypothetical protein
MVKIHKNIDRINNNVYLCSMTIGEIGHNKKIVSLYDGVEGLLWYSKFDGNYYFLSNSVPSMAYARAPLCDEDGPDETYEYSWLLTLCDNMFIPLEPIPIKRKILKHKLCLT